jgi:hypothetical protein
MCRRVVWYIPLECHIDGSLNYVKTCKCDRGGRCDEFIQSIYYTINFEKYTVPLSTFVLKLAISNSNYTKSIINIITSKFISIEVNKYVLKA